MLVDLPELTKRDQVAEAFERVLRPARRIALGVYLAHYNFGRELEANGVLVSEHPFDPVYNRDMSHEDKIDMIKDQSIPNDFGMCDSWQQILQRWPVILSDPRQLVIGLVPMRSELESYPYLGDAYHESDDRYLNIYFFHIYEVSVPSGTHGNTEASDGGTVSA